MARRCLWLFLLGMLGIASLLLAPLERLMPAGLTFSPLAFRALALVNPTILLVIATALGCWLAPKVGLHAPLVEALVRRQPAGAVLREQAMPAVTVGVGTAVLLIVYGLWSSGWTGAAQTGGFTVPLPARLLYGGLTEELLTRWGLMTLFVWLAWKLARSRTPVPAWCYWFGAAIAALLFAAGHLPLLFSLAPNPPATLVVAVLLGNAAPGLAFGWLFWRRGLEAAMLAHALAHGLAALAVTAG